MRIPAILLALAALSLPGIAATPNQPDVAYLLDGVREIAPGNVNSSLCVFGDRAFPVVNGREGEGGTEPLIAAARLGKGRMVISGNTAYLEQDALAAADTPRLVRNIVRWASGEKAAPRIGVYKIDGLAGMLRGLGLDARDIDLGGRAGVDVIMALARVLTDDDLKPLTEYVSGGGGLVTGTVGFKVKERAPGIDLATEFPGNRLIAPAGIVWAQDRLVGTPLNGFFHAEPPPEWSSAAAALAAFEASERRERILSANEVVQIQATLRRAIDDVPFNDTLLLPKLGAALAPFRARAIPSAAIPIEWDDMPWRLVIRYDSARLRHTPPEQVRAHPAAAEFPGSVPAGAPRVTTEVKVETSGGRWGWFGTGLYAAPGELITVRLPAGVVDKGLSIIIGAHADTLWHMDAWRRMPEISNRTPVRSAVTRAANAFGGCIYIAAPEGGQAGDFVATIGGGVPAPRYVDGKTSPAEWRSTIRLRPAPWAEIESSKVILTVPSALVRNLDDPAALMQVWDQTSDLVQELAGLPKERKRPERLLPDMQIGMEAVQHSGYPIMMQLSKAASLVSRDGLLRGRVGTSRYNKGVWGFSHEMGHNAHNPLWIFQGANEPTAQLFTVYVYEKLCHIPVESNFHASKEVRAAEMAEYNFAHPDFEQWKSDDWLALTMYVEMQQAFGWDAYKRVFAEYLKLPESQWPKTDDEKRDQWMVRFSRQVGRNLGPFFQAWGVPTSEAARKSIEDLPVWMPEELRAAR